MYLLYALSDTNRGSHAFTLKSFLGYAVFIQYEVMIQPTCYTPQPEFRGAGRGYHVSDSVYAMGFSRKPAEHAQYVAEQMMTIRRWYKSNSDYIQSLGRRTQEFLFLRTRKYVCPSSLSPSVGPLRHAGWETWFRR